MDTCSSKQVILGSALWGWGVDKEEVFRILDAFATSGGEVVDTASNYPINGIATDCGRASQWLAEWIKQNQSTELSVLLKVGAVDNSGSPYADLSAASLRDAVARYQELFSGRVSVVAIHWDSRGRGDISAVSESLGELKELRKSGLRVGFSGVNHPEIYRELAPELSDEWWIQVKENALTRAARQHYSPHFPNAKYLAYGINMGGVKNRSAHSDSSVALRGISPPEELVERISSFLREEKMWSQRPQSIVEFSLALAMSNPNLAGLIVGPRNVEQLQHTLNFSKERLFDNELYEKICSEVPLYR